MNPKKETGGELLNKYRSFIFGIAAFMILLCHLQPFVTGILPDAVAGLIGYGGVGVTIFAFLSGIGLRQSLMKNPSIKSFYIRRFKRVIITYLVIAAPYFLLYDIILTKNVSMFFLDTTCMSYWLYGRGAWYVAWIVPVYILYPYYNIIANRFKKRSVITAISMSLLILSMVFLYVKFPNILKDFASPIAATIAFILGDFYGEAVKNNKKSLTLILLLFVLPFPLYLLGIVKNDLVYPFFFSFCGIGLVSIFAFAAEFLPNAIVKIFSKLGKISLETYLINIFTAQLLMYFFKDKVTGAILILIYLVSIIVTILLGYLVSKILNRK